MSRPSSSTDSNDELLLDAADAAAVAGRSRAITTTTTSTTDRSAGNSSDGGICNTTNGGVVTSSSCRRPLHEPLHEEDTTTTTTTTSTSVASASAIKKFFIVSDNVIMSLNIHHCFKSALSNAKSHWKIVVLGQALSFLLACTGAAQATLNFECHLSAPTFTIGMFYFALAFCLVPVYCKSSKSKSSRSGKSKRNVRGQQQQQEEVLVVVSGSTTTTDHEDSVQQRQQQRETPPIGETLIGDDEDEIISNSSKYSIFWGHIPLMAPSWVYFLMAVIDVYANYFTVLAFKYTTITSVTLFDALAIPTSLILSKFALKRQYTALHYFGVLMCLLGVTVNVMQDYEDDNNTGGDGGSSSSEEVEDTTTATSNSSNTNINRYEHKLRGDIFALLGGIMFGINNVAGEIAVRKLGGVNEYLGMLGLFATIICFVQSIILERNEIAEFFGSDENKEDSCKESSLWYLLAVYFVTSVLSYLGGARFLQISEATFFNLSLLTGDLWSVAFSVIAERIVPHAWFFVALVFILSGTGIYEMAPSPVLEDRQHEEAEEAAATETTTASTPSTTIREKHPQHHYDLAFVQSSSTGGTDDENDNGYELPGRSSGSSSTSSGEEGSGFC